MRPKFLSSRRTLQKKQKKVDNGKVETNKVTDEKTDKKDID